MLKVPALQLLVHELSKLPGIGQKSAERIAYNLLRSPTEKSKTLAEALFAIKEKVHTCPQCYTFTEEDLCYYCSHPERLDSIICVVEEPSAIERIEQSRTFKGRYHVLHGAIAPLMGISPEKLKIQELVLRIEKGLQQEGAAVSELILALDADLEGDTTILYLTQVLSSYPIKLTRLAQGVPIGSGMDYLDERTLGRALQNRVEIETYSGFDRS